MAFDIKIKRKNFRNTQCSTGCSLNIVLFPKILEHSGLLSFSVFNTINTIFYEHPVPGLRFQSTFGRTACSCSLSRPPHHISKPSIDWLRPLTSEKAFLSSMPITSMSLSAKPPIVFAIGCQWQSHHNIFYIPSLKVLTSQSSGRLLNDAC